MEDNTIPYFQQAKDAFENKEYEKALKLFELSVEKEKNQAASIYINKCKKILGQTNNNPPPPQNTPEDTIDPSSTNTRNNESNNTTTNTEEEDKDKECLEYMKKKDYYDLLNVSKDASEEDLKKSYRRLAVKFHPDKNKSAHAAEVFKKIGNAFKILSDKEKRQFYDKYGTEEEFREKYQQQYHHQEDEEIDPFDLFNMFFNGGNFQYRRGPGGRVYVHRRGNEGAEENVQQARPNRFYLLFQVLPLLIFIFSSLGQSFFKSAPVYSFIPNEYNYRLMTSQANGINYYVGDKFYDSYKTPKDIEDLEYQIERDYLNFLNLQCTNAFKTKQELEYKLYYYRRTSYEPLIQRELNKIDFSVCNKLNELSQVNSI